MAVKDPNVWFKSDIAKRVLTIPVETAISLTDAVIFSFLVGFPFEILRVRSFCRTKAGVVTYQVKLATRIAVATANGVFTAATEVAATLSTTKANVRGTKDEVLTAELTTDGTGVLTNGRILVEYRRRFHEGDLGPT